MELHEPARSFVHTTPPPYLAIVLSCRVSAILDLEPTFSSWLIRSLEATFEDGIVDEIWTMIMTSANIILVTLELFGQRQTGQKLIPVALDSFGDLSAVSTNRPPNAAVTRTTTYRFTRSMQAIVLFQERPFPAFNSITAHQAHAPLRSRRANDDYLPQVS
ncbi:hypothetical protein PCH_Pc12g05810 [Penicillium rubens Wisconsin 54-1255]|uniref:Uncharacterized protein n=1 Tax=Penicillium rubens (strain ATCC 28089 / DSM 1075 / NRRL 1951 / Wisconsin 54-1255) TaxID=500485 RepID=B6GZP6_PENRW|nr:hypothetical protein PCH_Pc12g05810 [Penicillium rubens Wisconsin 54-1255]